jgi:hypothetical protein
VNFAFFGFRTKSHNLLRPGANSNEALQYYQKITVWYLTLLQWYFF